MDTTPELEEGERRDRYAYMGQRLEKQKLVYAYMPDDESKAGTYVITPRPMLTGITIGTLLERTITADGTFWGTGPKAPRPVGRWSIESDVSAWVAASQADRARKNALLLSGKQSSRVEQAMELLANTYQNLPGSQRTGFLAWVISQLGVKS